MGSRNWGTSIYFFFTSGLPTSSLCYGGQVYGLRLGGYGFSLVGGYWLLVIGYGYLHQEALMAMASGYQLWILTLKLLWIWLLVINKAIACGYGYCLQPLATGYCLCYWLFQGLGFFLQDLTFKLGKWQGLCFELFRFKFGPFKVSILRFKGLLSKVNVRV